ncbi:hypothetical protein C8J56DRAFT_901283 [Mycena floridula]|nr:hypothetical protein C8J56DRAFT_901283 [Mycena floridula]
MPVSFTTPLSRKLKHLSIQQWCVDGPGVVAMPSLTSTMFLVAVITVMAKKKFTSRISSHSFIARLAYCRPLGSTMNIQDEGLPLLAGVGLGAYLHCSGGGFDAPPVDRFPEEIRQVDALVLRLLNSSSRIETDDIPLAIVIHAAVKIIDVHDYTTEIGVNPSDAEKAQRNFISEVIFERRDRLWYLHLILFTIIHDTTDRYDGSSFHREDSESTIPGFSDSEDSEEEKSLNSDLRKQVWQRDIICKASGQIDWDDPEEHLSIDLVERCIGRLEIAHGIPWNPSPTYKILIKTVFGIDLPADPNRPENALLLSSLLHEVFNRFLISFQWSEEHKTRARADRTLLGIMDNVTGKRATSMDSRPLFYHHGCEISEPDRFWFDLRHLIGTVFWMADGAIPRGFRRDNLDDPGEFSMTLSDENIGLLMAKVDLFGMEKEKARWLFNEQKGSEDCSN